MHESKAGKAKSASRQRQDSLAEALHQSRRALIQTVHAISAVAARRDHYTARHQRRVATLALAIGRELRMAEDVLEGLYLGALIHDIGKVAIPSEVLTKPARLTAEEFALIRTHVRVGCEILESVILPWPVHAIVGQHHERLDGSGYPKGLRGEEIAPEARIVAVADVFQALCDYRPYRAALGIGTALEEIERGVGVTFDAEVVSALASLLARESETEAVALWDRLESAHESSSVMLPVLRLDLGNR
jgi:putative nucleotidyltransferase with HDIG domain